jgi:hypothetical protein
MFIEKQNLSHSHVTITWKATLQKYKMQVSVLLKPTELMPYTDLYFSKQFYKLNSM